MLLKKRDPEEGCGMKLSKCYYNIRDTEEIQLSKEENLRMKSLDLRNFFFMYKWDKSCKMDWLKYCIDNILNAKKRFDCLQENNKYEL